MYDYNRAAEIIKTLEKERCNMDNKLAIPVILVIGNKISKFAIRDVELYSTEYEINQVHEGFAYVLPVGTVYTDIYKVTAGFYAVKLSLYADSFAYKYLVVRSKEKAKELYERISNSIKRSFAIIENATTGELYRSEKSTLYLNLENFDIEIIHSSLKEYSKDLDICEFKKKFPEQYEQHKDKVDFAEKCNKIAIDELVATHSQSTDKSSDDVFEDQKPNNPSILKDAIFSLPLSLGLATIVVAAYTLPFSIDIESKLVVASWFATSFAILIARVYQKRSTRNNTTEED